MFVLNKDFFVKKGIPHFFSFVKRPYILCNIYKIPLSKKQKYKKTYLVLIRKKICSKITTIGIENSQSKCQGYKRTKCSQIINVLEQGSNYNL